VRTVGQSFFGTNKSWCLRERRVLVRLNATLRFGPNIRCCDTVLWCTVCARILQTETASTRSAFSPSDILLAASVRTPLASLQHRSGFGRFRARERCKAELAFRTASCSYQSQRTPKDSTCTPPSYASLPKRSVPVRIRRPTIPRMSSHRFDNTPRDRRASMKPSGLSARCITGIPGRDNV
jgi:hypothetical protein